MRLQKSIYFILLLLLSFNTNLANAFAEEEKCNSVNKLLFNSTKDIFYYQENRNDIGIFYDFEWDSKNKKIKFKRNEENYPVVRFSLFEKKKIKPGNIVKTLNNIDLSKILDTEINDLSKTKTITNVELNSGEKILINPRPYKKNEFKLSYFKIKSIHNIDTAKGILEIAFESEFTNRRKDFENSLEKKIENFSNLSWIGPVCNDLKKNISTPISTIKFNEYKYDVDIREGKENKEKIKKSFIDLTIDKGKIRTLRKEEGIGFFRQDFNFRKFPFDIQKLIISIETGVRSTSNPNLNSQSAYKYPAVTFITPEVGPFIDLETFITNNYLKEWKIIKEKTKIKSSVRVEDNFYDKWLNRIISHHENILKIEITIERNWAHYFFKIMLPVFLILCVAWYVLWIPTRKYETRLNTSIIALLALIAYNFVFQDDIPKLNYLTDLDWYILLSYFFCCIPVFVSIASSKLGTKNQKMIVKINKFTRSWGILFYLITTFAIFKII
tara:strand:+ start:164 stop:1657 length:1494 start_codon:yes stop_codon:yes gene_type:complete